MPADYSRIHRLLKIITLIQGQRGYTAQKLADECKVTLRTIYRDMKILESLGIPYFHNPQSNGYQIRRDFFMPPLQLTLDEALALVTLGEQVGEREQVPMTRAASRALIKLRGNLPGKIQDELAQIDPHLCIDLPPTGPKDGYEDVYDTVRQAIATRRVLLCSYESIETSLRSDKASGKKGQKFELRPYALFFSHRAWYVAGLHSGRGEVRILKLNRFDHIKLTDKPYAIPDDFSLRSHLGNAWRMIRGPKRYDVAIHFDREFADTVNDTHWHPTQKFEHHEDGSITLEFKVDGLDEIVWWVLSMGPHCRVKKPAELIQRVKELAQATADRYTPASGDEPKKSRTKLTR